MGEIGALQGAIVHSGTMSHNGTNAVDGRVDCLRNTAPTRSGLEGHSDCRCAIVDISYELPECSPGSTVAERQRARFRLTSDAAGGSPPPVPLRLTDCGLPPPLSLISNDALRVPAPEGVNVTVIPQLLPAARVTPQVLLFEKSAALAPRKAICQMFIGRLPKLLTVTV